MVIVSEDMRVLGHIHPHDFEEQIEGGEARVHFTFPRPGRYLVAEAAGAGTWKVDQLLLVPAGSRSIRLDALISDFEKASMGTEITLR